MSQQTLHCTARPSHVSVCVLLSISHDWKSCLLQALGNDVELTRTTVFNIFAKFLYVFGASLVVGLTFGLGTAVLLKLLKSNSAPQVTPATVHTPCCG